MAIKIGNLHIKDPAKKYLFVDLNYDIFPDKLTNDSSIPSKNDINTSYDLNAIKNEIRNLLNLPKYSRILNPEFGFDFKTWIGKPVDQGFAEMQKMGIVNILKSGSSRFKLNGLQIIAVPEQRLYYIEMKISSPYFTTQHDVQGYVDTTGVFSFI